MRDLAALALVLALAGCSSFPNRKVEQPVTYKLHVKDFEGELDVADLVKLKGRVGEYTIETEGSELYTDAPDAP